MNAVIYARYSCEGQREESIEGQLRECLSYAERNNMTVLSTYVDRAISGKNADNRPEFQKMIKDSSKRMFDIILVWKLDRFARNRYDSATFKCILKKHNVRVVSATENISEGSEGILLESVLEGMAEYFSADLSEKVVRGLTENALKCKSNGGTIPTGYYVDENHKLAVNPTTAPIVLDVFTKYADGMTMKQLSDYLTEKGIRSAKGGKMTVSIVEYMLKNRRYIGEYRYRDIVHKDGIPAIVPQELFDSVQERMQKNKRAPSRHKAEDDYLLTTKLFCGKCGATMVGECGTSSAGVTHRYYRCSTSKRKRLVIKRPLKKIGLKVWSFLKQWKLL